MKEMYFTLPSLLFLLLLSCVSSVDVQNSILEDDLNTNMLQESIVQHINANSEYGWTATLYPRFANYTIGEFKKIFGGTSMINNRNISDLPTITHGGNLNLPKEFDARKQWPKCTNIGKIRDQGHCGCCWAFSSIGALSDRFCIHNGENVVLSVNDPLACCGATCGSCKSGFPEGAYKYASTKGVVTEECYPYFDKKGCPDIAKCTEQFVAPKCETKCKGGNLQWSESKHYSEGPYKLPSNQKAIMEEVYKNGPIPVQFYCYLDFATYKSGVYKHKTGQFIGHHIVKLIGWGTSPQGEDYWLLANEWNVNWGEKGLIKFKRGTNECGIEKILVATMPSKKRKIGDDHDIIGSNSVGYASV